MASLKVDTLHYTKRTEGKFRDYRSVELTRKKKFARISINGIHRNPRSIIKSTRYANPGWSFGTESVYVNWTHFKRHCFHFSINVMRRGITFSYGRRII